MNRTLAFPTLSSPTFTLHGFPSAQVCFVMVDEEQKPNCVCSDAATKSQALQSLQRQASGWLTKEASTGNNYLSVESSSAQSPSLSFSPVSAQSVTRDRHCAPAHCLLPNG